MKINISINPSEAQDMAIDNDGNVWMIITPETARSCIDCGIFDVWFQSSYEWTIVDGIEQLDVLRKSETTKFKFALRVGSMDITVSK